MQRWLKFSKYLPEFGWQPIILTVKNGSFPSTDDTLLNDVDERVIVYRTKTIEPFEVYNLLRGKKGKSVEVGMGNIKDPKGMLAKAANYIRGNYFIPDARVGWNRYAVAKAKQIIKEHKPLAIITTGPPHSTHLIGLKLKEVFETPWIADFRDPWTEIFYNQFLNRTQSSKDKDLALESLVLKKSDLLIAATPTIKSIYKSRKENAHVVLNGYDQTDLPDSTPDKQNKIFTISFFGNMLPNQNLTTVWKALAELKKEKGNSDFIAFKIIGNSADNVKESISKYGLNDIVEFHPFVKHKEAVKGMFSSNMLYLPIPEDAGNKLILTGKIFEYLASQRPILSVGPANGDADLILKQANQQAMHDYNDLAGIKNTIETSLERFNRTKEYETVGNEFYKTLSRKEQTKKLSEILNSMVISSS